MQVDLPTADLRGLQGGIDDGRSRAPILMDFQTRCACSKLFEQWLDGMRGRFCNETEVYRKGLSCLEH